MPRHRTIDNHHSQSGAGIVLRAEFSACKQLDSHGLEISWRYRHEKRVRFSRSWRLTNQRNVDPNFAPTHRRIAADCDSGDAGNSSSSGSHSRVQILCVACRTLRLAVGDSGNNHAAAIKTDIKRFQIEEAVEQESRSREDGYRESDLNCDKRFP